MGRYASEPEGGSFTPAPVGTHIARCFRIVDLGTQHGEYMGKPTRRNQIHVTWELPDELDGEGRPMLASRFYTNSLGERANLRKDLESWRGRSFTDDELRRFDLESILGKPCMLTVVGGDNGKTKIATVSGLPKSSTCPAQVNPSFTFWLDEFDQEKFESLSDGIKGIIKKSEEYMDSGGNPSDYHQPERRQIEDDDDIPF